MKQHSGGHDYGKQCYTCGKNAIGRCYQHMVFLCKDHIIVAHGNHSGHPVFKKVVT